MKINEAQHKPTGTKLTNDIKQLKKQVIEEHLKLEANITVQKYEKLNNKGYVCM